MTPPRANLRKRKASPSPSDQKIQRWIDLVAALLSHHYGVTFDDLRELVPAYASGADPKSVARMFERDKDELRAFGIPIATLDPTDELPQRYRVIPSEMYLPYLMLASAGSRSPRTTRRTKPGYHSLPTLTFEADELHALVCGARESSRLGDSSIAADATGALRKLAYDLDVPIGATFNGAENGIVTPREPATAARVRTLGEALLRLKRVTFTYRSMSSDVTSERTAEPYGLFFQSGHWYLAARDVAKGDVRNFRVSRMDDVRMNRAKAQSVDYEIPAEFRLSSHAKTRGPWELGDGDAQAMVVEFHGESGPTAAALKLGDPSPLGERHRTFQVRRLDSFARWLLSFAGEVTPVSPARLVDEYRALAKATLGVYEVGA